MGYIVDVINYDDKETIINDEYDLLIGFGRADELSIRMQRKTLKLYLGTGSEASFQNEKEQKRVMEVNRKYHTNLRAKRLNQFDSQGGLDGYDALVCLGNEFTASTFRAVYHKDIYLWNNHGYDNLMGIPMIIAPK